MLPVVWIFLHATLSCSITKNKEQLSLVLEQKVWIVIWKNEQMYPFLLFSLYLIICRLSSKNCLQLFLYHMNEFFVKNTIYFIHDCFFLLSMFYLLKVLFSLLNWFFSLYIFFYAFLVRRCKSFCFI